MAELKTVYLVSEGSYDDWSNIAVFESEEDANSCAGKSAGSPGDQRAVTRIALFVPGQYRQMQESGALNVWYVRLDRYGDVMESKVVEERCFPYAMSGDLSHLSGPWGWDDLTYSSYEYASTADEAVTKAQTRYAGDPQHAATLEAFDEWRSLVKNGTIAGDDARHFFPWYRQRLGQDAA